jgi:hypothetical protein
MTSSSSADKEWIAFLERNKSQLSKISECAHGKASPSQRKNDFDVEQDVINPIFSVVFTYPEERSGNLDDDLQRLNRVVSSIIKFNRDRTLTDEEAKSIVDLIVGKFVESRFNKLVSASWPMKLKTKRWFLGVKDSFK